MNECEVFLVEYTKNWTKKFVESNVKNCEELVDESRKDVASSSLSRSNREIKILKKYEDFEMKALFYHNNTSIPQSCRQAIESNESEEWKKAMEGKGVWTVVDENCVD